MKISLHKSLFLLALATLLGACSNEPAPAPNIILVSVDTLRWDYLNPYGFELENHTPAVNRLADNGIVFENAVSTAGTTVPSHGSMLTGLYPRIHGARSNFHGMYPQVRSVTEALNDSGYQTGAFVSTEFLIKTGKLGAGFDTTNTPFPRLTKNGKSAPQTAFRTINQAIEWVDELDQQEPMFMWMHLWEPHGPYDPTDWSREHMKDYDGFLNEGLTVQMARTRVREIIENPEHLEAVRTLYAGEVNLFDQHLGRFLDHLDKNGMLDNTVVIFTADHGQAIGEDGRMGHGAVHWETVIRVPLIVADFRENKSSRISTRVGTVDIAPTIADMASLEKPFDYSGRSLRGGEELASDWPYFAEVELRATDNPNDKRAKQFAGYDPRSVAVYTDTLKMIYKNEQYRMYETGTDMKVARRIDMDAEPVMADYLQGLLDNFSETEIDLSQDEISDEDLRVLQSLGYIQ